jgi:GT2 family glycosyltransferase
VSTGRDEQENRSPGGGDQGKVYVILVNWNGWQDTIQCLESVFKTTYPNYQVVICDNGSKDGSLDYIREWAEGRRSAATSDHPFLRSLTTPAVAKPIPYAIYNRLSAEVGGGEEAAAARLILIRNDQNQGFAAGNNVALRFALARQDLAYAWILNNDTVVSPRALSALVRCAQTRPTVGLCGSTLLYYDSPQRVQTRGGIAYNPWFATMRPLGKGDFVDQPIDRDWIERSMDYPAGASVLVRRQFLETVGLLSESYFLYYEELDWVTRAGPRFEIGYSPDSVVYHKEGTSFQSTESDGSFHPADFYAHRNRLRYTRRFFPIGLPTTLLRTLAAVFARLWRGQPRRAWGILRLIFQRETYRFPARDLGRSNDRSRSGRQ